MADDSVGRGASAGVARQHWVWLPVAAISPEVLIEDRQSEIGQRRGQDSTLGVSVVVLRTSFSSSSGPDQQ